MLPLNRSNFSLGVNSGPAAALLITLPAVSFQVIYTEGFQKPRSLVTAVYSE